MAWFPVSLFKHTGAYRHARMTMHERFVYERRYATMVKMKHGFATLNFNNSVVYVQKHKV